MKIGQTVKFLLLGLLILSFVKLQAQNEPNDCDNIITVCGNGNFQSNATGPGNNPTEVNSCGGFEHNSLWLEVNIAQAGTLGFDLIPNDPDIMVDYDFWVYGPNRLCSNLGSPIRCATTNPNQAGLANNHTGINGSTTLTQTGPGPNGNGYVFWLTVAVGETYYIVVDRPDGDGGFEIQWTGTAMQGTGAFPAPPTTNAIDDVIACSGTPDISIFNLDGLKSSINADPSNTIEFYENLADATDGINALPGIYANTSNPQQIYAKVLSGTTDCYSLVDFNLVVSPIPDAQVSVDRNTICDGESVSFTFTGTENTTVNYNINGGATQHVVMDASGVATLNQVLTVNSTLTLESVQVIDGSGTVICSQNLTDSESITVNPSETPDFAQVADICSGETLAALPTTSNNGITGTWSPALDNTTTTTYTFTPDGSQCAFTQTMTITVNPNITPNFTQVADICSGETLAALPTTSDNGVTGTWSPALDNTATTTYTFTPDAGQCASNQTMTITVNPNVTPTFTQVADICSGETLAALPTTSDNGVTGTWSPALDNTATTTYTFTPDAGQCAYNQTMTITVNPNITPTFTQVADICSGETLATLPTTSDNNVTGTWSPALDNTATTTYTFTPDAGQCATEQTMTITVNPNTSPDFTQVADICSGETLAPLPTTSNNGVTGTWSPALDNTTTTTYTFTPDAGQCATEQTMLITVNQNIIPNFTQVPDICSGETLAELPTTSNNGVVGTWSPALDNTATTTYTFTPDAGQCASNQTMTITVNPNVTPTFTQVADICSGETLAALPTTSDNGVTGTWSPALDNTATTTYTFTPDAGQCAYNQTMTITVNPNITPTFTQVADICSGETLATLPTTSDNNVTGTWSPALDNTATTTYTFTPDAGQCATEQTMTITVNPNTSPDFTQVADICSGETLAPLPTTSNNGVTGTWSPALDNTTTTTYTFTPDAGQCATEQTMLITVNQNIIPNFTQVPDICSGETLAELPTTSNNGVVGTWSPALDNTATTTYTFTPDAGQCAIEQTMTITVNPVIDPEFTQMAPRCSGQNINPLPTTSNNGVTGTWSPAIDNTTTTVYTFTPDAGQCANEQTMRIIVSPTPIIVLDNLSECTLSGNGYFDFDLNAEIPAILGSTQDASDFTVAFFEDASASMQITTNPYTNSTAYNHIIYVQITDNATLCDAIFPFNLTVEDAAIATTPNPINICDGDGENDGFFQYDLTTLNAEILNGQDPNNYIVDYFEDPQDAEDGVNAISNPDTFVNSVANNQTIYIRVYHASSPDVCYDTTSVSYTVNPILKPLISSLTGNNTLCVDFETNAVLNSVTLVSDLQNANYVYTWFLNGVEITGENDSELIIDAANPGVYTLSIEENTPIANCTSAISEGFEVFQSGPPVLLSVTQTETFEPNPRITVSVDGYGEYWFQLDDDAPLDNGGVFTGVSSGTHTVTVFDMKTNNPSCGTITVDDITIINYPKVLTPNNDGYNDTWHVFAVSDQPSTIVKIFDRYGKLLKQLRPNDIGWDGTFRGQPLPATDYWFDLTYEENGELKHFVSHFSLRR
ncbi:T9SS type B sorting domain-containing protein [Neotamlana sedimentorum]|uniref:T9SS type B sorting domain-containing protein n=1 Tax=Neotamlana sedimentorum TaxID=1435349 RepID=UPI00069B50D1|nr:T9SS type B sorting domain-containing protein [Tamlana sedimentorum]